MTRRPLLLLFDDDGRPLRPDLQAAVCQLLPRCARTFPACRDDLFLLDVLEEAGRKLAARDRDAGPLTRLHAYAWVTLRSVVSSRLRRSDARVMQHRVAGPAATAALAAVPARWGSPEQLDCRLLVHELLAQLSPEERRLWVLKAGGLSSHAIAARCGRTPGAVDTLWFRVRQRLRDRLGVPPETDASGDADRLQTPVRRARPPRQRLPDTTRRGRPRSRRTPRPGRGPRPRSLRRS